MKVYFNKWFVAQSSQSVSVTRYKIVLVPVIIIVGLKSSQERGFLRRILLVALGRNTLSEGKSASTFKRRK